jgi:WD40 repeat protein
VLDVATGSEVTRLNPVGKSWVESGQLGVFSLDGHFLVVSISGKKGGKSHATIRDMTTGNEVWRLPTHDNIDVFGAAGRFAVTTPERGPWDVGFLPSQINIWDISEKRKLGPLQTDVEGFMVKSEGLSPDGRWAFAWGALLFEHVALGHVWSLPSCRKQLEMRGTSAISCWDFDPDGRLLAVGYEDDTLQMWDIEGSEMLFDCKFHGKDGTILRFTPDGKFLAATNGESPNLQLLDLTSLRRQLAEIGLDW